MKNVMVDLETFGNGSNSVIVAIGAAMFDETGVGGKFYTLVDPQSCVDVGMQMDASTILWWLKQSDPARNALTCAPGPKLEHALLSLISWWPHGATLWGNGATFDNVILANAYSAVKVQRPWKYTADRCYRTMKALFPTITPPSDIGVAHNALDDAVYQATHMVEILKAVQGANNAIEP